VFRNGNLGQTSGTVPSGKVGVIQLSVTPQFAQLYFYYRV